MVHKDPGQATSAPNPLVLPRPGRVLTAVHHEGARRGTEHFSLCSARGFLFHSRVP